MIENSPKNLDFSEHVPVPEKEVTNLSMLRDAIAAKDLNATKAILEKVKDMMEAGTVKCSPISDKDVEDLINTGNATIYIVTGTAGDRILFTHGRMYMSIENDPYSRKRRDLFRVLFGLPAVEEETEEPSVNVFAH